MDIFHVFDFRQNFREWCDVPSVELEGRRTELFAYPQQALRVKFNGFDFGQVVRNLNPCYPPGHLIIIEQPFLGADKESSVAIVQDSVCAVELPVFDPPWLTAAFVQHQQLSIVGANEDTAGITADVYAFDVRLVLGTFAEALYMVEAAVCAHMAEVTGVGSYPEGAVGILGYIADNPSIKVLVAWPGRNLRKLGEVWVAVAHTSIVGAEPHSSLPVAKYIPNTVVADAAGVIVVVIINLEAPVFQYVQAVFSTNPDGAVLSAA